MRTAVWSALHFLVDMVCAWAMYAFFCDGNYESLLVYNFCAFALQLPFGTLLDLCAGKQHRLPSACAALGVIATLVGAFVHPSVLGIGNALFHTGAGVDVIEEDFSRNRNGRALGVFVAPGAVGLYIGMLLGKRTAHSALVWMAGLFSLVLLLCLWRCGTVYRTPTQHKKSNNNKVIILTACCFAVVVIRSLVGLAVTFPWKSVPLLGAAAVCAAASGKCCGGILAAKFGMGRTATVTLLLASACYLAADNPVCGIGAVFLFNMSMPLTLYLLADHLPGLPGFSFGLLTFGLFLGFLPVYWQIELPLSGYHLGTVGSIISCILLIAAGKVVFHDAVSV